MSNFERARNKDIRTRWAGDPERWGGASKIQARVTRNLPGVVVPVAGLSAQLLRAQASDLIAIAWDLVCTWELDGVTDDDEGVLALECQLGTGQAASKLYWTVADIWGGVAKSRNAPAAPLAWGPNDEQQVLPYNAQATIPAGAAGPVAHVPAVPPDYQLKLSSWSIATSMVARSEFVLEDGLGLQLAAQTFTPAGCLVPAPLDLWTQSRGSTPAVSSTVVVGVGNYVTSFVSGTLHRVGGTGTRARGVAISSSPIVATSLNVRASLRVFRTGGVDHDVTGRVTAHCSPRSWVP